MAIARASRVRRGKMTPERRGVREPDDEPKETARRRHPQAADSVETRYCASSSTRASISTTSDEPGRAREAAKLADVLVPTVTDRSTPRSSATRREAQADRQFRQRRDNIDVATALQRGITVTNTPGVLTRIPPT